MAGLGVALALGVAYMTGPIPGVLDSSIVNTAATTYYVDAAGNDGNACISLASPCLTCQGALNKIPKRLRYPAKVLISTGTFAGCNVEGFSIESLYAANSDTNYPAMLTLEGTLSAYTPATGVQTGTVASATAESATAFGTATVTAAGWTVNDLAGRIFHTLTGTGSGQYLMVASNTATVVTFTGAPTTLGSNTTFEILSPATEINAVNAPGLAGVALSNMARATEPVSGTVTTVETLIRYLRFTGSIRGVRVDGTNSRVTIDNCRFENVTSGAIITLNSGGAEITARRNAILTGSQPGIVAGSFSYWTVTGNYYSGTGRFLSTTLSSNTVLFSDRNYMATGISFAAISLNNAWSSTRDRAAAATGYCVEVGIATTSGTAANGRVDVTNGNFSNCVSGAFSFDGQAPGRLDTVVGTGSTGYGITATHGAHVEITSGTTVTGTTNDLLIDGTAYSYATLRALVPKTVFTTTFGTNVYER